MNFEYQWTDKGKGNYAIRKIGSKTKKQAGKEIERLDKQTASTHHILRIEPKYAYEVIKINKILQTITFIYVESGTKQRSIRQYLSKTDLDGILQNIEGYKNKEIIIELSAPKMPRNEATRIKKEGNVKLRNRMIKMFGKEQCDKILTLAIERNEKETALNELIKKEKNEIKKVEKRIDAFIFEVIGKKYEHTDFNTMIQKLEKSLKNTNNETKRNEISKVISQAKEEQSKAEGTMKKYRDLIIQTFSILAKAEKEREGRKRRQKEYRDSKKIKARMNGIKV